MTAAQLVAADRLYEQTKAAVDRYRDLRVAIAAGYQPMEPPDLEIVHYVNRAYFTEQDILQPQHVQSLIYYNTPKGPVLIGAMYIMPRWGMPGPEIGGALTNWHHHDNLCYDKKTNMVVASGDSPSSIVPGGVVPARPAAASRTRPTCCMSGSSTTPTGHSTPTWIPPT